MTEAAGSPHLYAGVDVGASRTKVAIIDSARNLVGHCVRKSGTDFAETAADCFESSLAMAGADRSRIAGVVSTGYGRNNVSFAHGTRTEISCHARGCYYYFPFAITIIDIGGQDNKIIKLDEQGARYSFKMNRKCAAGTGAFLEEMAARLDVPIEAMNDLAQRSEDMVKLGSFCTVFSATEVLESIRAGKELSDIVKGVFFSIVNRVLEMDSFTEHVVMTGGVVAHNPFLAIMTGEALKKRILVPGRPQLSGAFGAALCAMETTGI
jgi:predicted CoA-substrate-specific enzyme activase